jgi:putative acetyltransferase
VVIRRRIPADDVPIAALNDAAFGGRHESRLVEELREAGLAAIELVAEEKSDIVGHILFSALSVVSGDRSVRALALAPMSVHPGRQRSGIGGALVRRGLDLARDGAWQAVIVFGHAGYYPRFGFSPALARRLKAPFSGASFMAIELQEGALGGDGWRVVYPAAFGVGEA